LDDDDDGDDVTHVNTRRVSCAMSVLTSWYAHVSKVRHVTRSLKHSIESSAGVHLYNFSILTRTDNVLV